MLRHDSGTYGSVAETKIVRAKRDFRETSRETKWSLSRFFTLYYFREKIVLIIDITCTAKLLSVKKSKFFIFTEMLTRLILDQHD